MQSVHERLLLIRLGHNTRHACEPRPLGSRRVRQPRETSSLSTTAFKVHTANTGDHWWPILELRSHTYCDTSVLHELQRHGRAHPEDLTLSCESHEAFVLPCGNASSGVVKASNAGCRKYTIDAHDNARFSTPRMTVGIGKKPLSHHSE